MEARDIAMIAYELFRVKEDRDCMFYEDLLSYAARDSEIARQKTRKLKQALYDQKKMYELLVQKVTEIGTVALEATSNVLREVPSSSAAKEPRPEPQPSHEEVCSTQETTCLLDPPSPEAPQAPAVPRSNASVSSTSTSTSSTRTAASPPPPTQMVAEAQGRARWRMSTSDSASLQLGLHSRAPSEPALSQRSKDSSLARKRLRLASRSVAATVAGGSDSVGDAHDSSDSSNSGASSDGEERSKRRAKSKLGGSTLSYQPARPRPETSSHPAAQRPCIEVVRNREQRAALPGFSCFECERFYRTMMEQGIINEENKKDFLQSCSRHKARWTPPSTPDGFWDLAVNTPPEWKTS